MIRTAHHHYAGLEYHQVSCDAGLSTACARHVTDRPLERVLRRAIDDLGWSTAGGRHTCAACRLEAERTTLGAA